MIAHKRLHFACKDTSPNTATPLKCINLLTVCWRRELVVCEHLRASYNELKLADVTVILCLTSHAILRMALLITVKSILAGSV